MAKIIITTDENELIEVQGRMTFEVNKIEDETGNVTLVTSGQLSMHNYIEGIIGIESARYKLTDVEIVREIFGTNDFNILYEFVLTDGYSFEVKEDVLNEIEIKEIEDKEYKEDDSRQWDGELAWKSETK